MSRLVLSLALVTTSIATAQEQAATKPGRIEPAAVNLGRPVDFQKDIVPVFDAKCLACHNVAITESRFNLEDVPNILKGGKRGPAVVPKEPDKSLIYLAASRAMDPVMPPLPNKVEAMAFTPQELGLLRQWILEGAAAGMSAGPSPSLAWQPIPPTMNAIYALALNPWGRFAACGRANQLDVYDLSIGEHVSRLQDPHLASLKIGDKPVYPRGAAHQDFVHAVAFHPTQNLIASAGFREVKLWQRPENVQRRMIALEPAPTAAALSPNGQWLAVAGVDNAVRLIQTADGQAIRAFNGHAAPVTGLQFSADNTKLFTAAKDKTVRAWIVADGQPAGVLETPAEIACVVLNTEGNRVFTGHADNFIRGWNVPFEAPKPAEGDKAAEPVKPVVQMQSNGALTALALVPGQPQLASASVSGNWFIWDVNNGNQVRNGGHGAPVVSLSVKPDGQFLATAGGNFAKLWNINGQQVAEMKGDVRAQRRVIELTDDDAVAKSRVGLADASFKAAEKNLKEREEQTKKAKEARDAAEKAKSEADAKLKTATDAVAAAKTELAAKTDDEALKKKVADAEAAATKEMEAAKKALDALEAAAKAHSQSEKGQQVADEQQKAAKQLHDAEIIVQKQVEENFNAGKAALPATEKPVRAVAFTLDGKSVATAGDDGVVRTWDAKTGKPLDDFTAHKGPVAQLVAGPDRLLVSLSEDKSAILWDANPSWQLAGVLGPAPASPLDLAPSPFVSRVLSLAFSPDGKLLATGGGDPSRSGEVLLWNVETKAFVKALPDAHSDTVFSIDFSRDGKWLLSGAADKFVKVHDVETGKLVRSFEGHTHHVLGVSFKADGSRIASAGADNAIKIWNVETGEQHRTIQNYSKQVTGIHFIGASDNTISGSGDKTVKMHRANDGGNYRGFGGPTDFVYAIACTRDETIVAAGGEEGALRIWNGQNAQVLFTFEPPKPPAENTQANAK